MIHQTEVQKFDCCPKCGSTEGTEIKNTFIGGSVVHSSFKKNSEDYWSKTLSSNLSGHSTVSCLSCGEVIDTYGFNQSSQPDKERPKRKRKKKVA